MFLSCMPMLPLWSGQTAAVLSSETALAQDTAPNACALSTASALIGVLMQATQKSAKYGAIQQVLNKLQEAGVETDP